MRIKADLYSGRLFEYWEPKARPLDATGHQPSQYEDKHRDRSKHETQSYNDDERRHRDQNEKFANKPYWIRCQKFGQAQLTARTRAFRKELHNLEGRPVVMV